MNTNHRIIPITAGALFAALLAGTTGFAAEERPVDAKTFMHDAASDGLAEVELGKLAAAKATDAGVKAFAQRMVDDHSKANGELEQIAAKKSVTLPTTVDAKHADMREQLAKLSGAAFDTAYVDDMVRGHEHAVDAFSAASKSADDDVAAFASKTLPTLKDHMRQVKQLQETLHGARSTREGDAERVAR